ncbi:hypothetical protein AMTR_s00088p00050490 [Amborella trichopoda]|uniref:Uncharacterized protein n=1 Tax=Amborella trichopoda TaxID=13333 RepID=W1NW00_AMBTC|nr:hypothetical protein AMTR_s00088p00050490 [Amborella trichopoda]
MWGINLKKIVEKMNGASEAELKASEFLLDPKFLENACHKAPEQDFSKYDIKENANPFGVPHFDESVLLSPINVPVDHLKSMREKYVFTLREMS